MLSVKRSRETIEKENKMTIPYQKVYDKGLRIELTEARYKGVVMQLQELEDMVFYLWHGVYQ